MTTWPPDWKLCTADSPAEGQIIPLEYPDQDEQERCANCHGKPLLGFRVLAFAVTIRHFETSHGGVDLHGRLVIGGCPVCSSPKPVPPAVNPETNGEPYWNT